MHLSLAGEMADLSEDDLIIVGFSRADHSTMVGPLPGSPRPPGRRAGNGHCSASEGCFLVHCRGKGALRSSSTYIGGKRFVSSIASDHSRSSPSEKEHSMQTQARINGDP